MSSPTSIQWASAYGTTVDDPIMHDVDFFIERTFTVELSEDVTANSDRWLFAIWKRFALPNTSLDYIWANFRPFNAHVTNVNLMYNHASSESLSCQISLNGYEFDSK